MVIIRRILALITIVILTLVRLIERFINIFAFDKNTKELDRDISVSYNNVKSIQYINGQGREEYKLYRFGNLGTMSNNGCMAIAMYNANIVLGKYSELSDIELYIVKNGGTVLGGILGGNPLCIESYYEYSDMHVSHLYYPSLDEVERHIRDSKVSILMYWVGVGAHFVAIRYDSLLKSFHIYNVNNTSKDSFVCSDVIELMSDKNRVIVIYTII